MRGVAAYSSATVGDGLRIATHATITSDATRNIKNDLALFCMLVCPSFGCVGFRDVGADTRGEFPHTAQKSTSTISRAIRPVRHMPPGVSDEVNCPFLHYTISLIDELMIAVSVRKRATVRIALMSSAVTMNLR